MSFRVAKVGASHVFYADDATFDADRVTGFWSLAPHIPLARLPRLTVPGAWETFTAFPWREIFSNPDVEHIVCTDSASCMVLDDMLRTARENDGRRSRRSIKRRADGTNV